MAELIAYNGGIVMWVVTRSINAYEQDGEYFVAVFTNQPDFHALKKLLPEEDDVTIGKLSRGGGRQCYEAEWFDLYEMKNGERFPY